MSEFVFSRWWKSNTVAIHSIKNTSEANIRTQGVKTPHGSNFHDLHFKVPFNVWNSHMVSPYARHSDTAFGWVWRVLSFSPDCAFLVLPTNLAVNLFWFSKFFLSRILIFPGFTFEWAYSSEFTNRKQHGRWGLGRSYLLPAVPEAVHIY